MTSARTHIKKTNFQPSSTACGLRVDSEEAAAGCDGIYKRNGSLNFASKIRAVYKNAPHVSNGRAPRGCASLRSRVAGRPSAAAQPSSSSIPSPHNTRHRPAALQNPPRCAHSASAAAGLTANSTMILRPSMLAPDSSDAAAADSSLLAIVTNPKPRERPVSRSVITCANRLSKHESARHEGVRAPDQA